MNQALLPFDNTETNTETTQPDVMHPIMEKTNVLPFRKSTEIKNIKTSEMKKIMDLAKEAVVSDSLLVIKGAKGTGKSHSGRVLQWLSENSLDRKDEFPWKCYTYTCNGQVESKELLTELIQAVRPDALIYADRIPSLMRQLVKVMVAGGPGLLFLDNAHRLSAYDYENIQDVVQMVRDETNFGLVLASLCEHKLFDAIQPTTLAEVILKKLSPSYNMQALGLYDSRILAWIEAFKANKEDPEASSVASALMVATEGNFEKIVSLCKSLRQIKETSLSAECIIKLLNRRST